MDTVIPASLDHLCNLTNAKGLPLYLQELECLQDHLDDLAVECRDIVSNLTELESEVSSWQLTEGECPVSSLSFFLGSTVSRPFESTDSL